MKYSYLLEMLFLPGKECSSARLSHDINTSYIQPLVRIIILSIQSQFSACSHGCCDLSKQVIWIGEGAEGSLSLIVKYEAAIDVN